MEITLDLSSLLVDGQIPNPLQFARLIFLNGGWIFVLVLAVVGTYIARLQRRENINRSEIEYIFLAIDVPKENEQSLKAVEQIFAQFSAIQLNPNFVEKWWDGKIQETFSVEVISIEGFIQFVIRVAKDFRDVVESAVYSQYPDAEIVQVEDYAKEFARLQFPSEEYNLWGTDFKLERNEVYPIRTYMNFEHTLTQKFADPMASLLESMSRLGVGEQFWVQLVLTPIDQNWQDSGVGVIKKLIGAKSDDKDKMGKFFLGTIGTIGDQVFGAVEGGNSNKKSDLPTLIQHMTEGQKGVVKAIEEKLAKIGFKVKFRIIYLAKKEVYHKGRGVAPMAGAIKQFNTLNLNAFKSHKSTKTSANYFFIKRRIAAKQKKVLRRYINRVDHGEVGNGFVLNIEELASMYHFPILDVKAPLVKKTEERKGEPPAMLPTEFNLPVSSSGHKEHSQSKSVPARMSGPPSNLPMG